MPYDPRTFNFWQAQIAHQKDKSIPEPELELNVAYPGNYRWPTKRGVKLVLVRPGPDGETVYWIDGQGPKYADDTFCENIFSWCCRNAVTQAVVDEYTKTGRWPEDPPEPIERPGSNLPENFLEAMRERLKGEIDEIKMFLAEPLDTKEKVDRAANWAARLIREIRDPVELNRKREKQPHLDEARAVDDAHKPIHDAADQWARRLKDAQTNFLKAEKQRQIEEARKRAEEELARTAASAEMTGLSAEEAQQAASRRAPYVERPKASAGTVGSRTALREVRRAVIYDWAAFCEWAVKGSVDFVEEVQKIADTLARQKIQAPGMKIEKDEVAR